MAVIHHATLTPTKLGLLEPWLARQPWGGSDGPLERVGGYRFDDPDGEVGIEGLLVRRGDEIHHALLTYRGVPLEGAGEWLVGTMEHSVLGTRWAYDGVGDPVAVAALVRAARGEQRQALLEVHDADGVIVQRPDPDVTVRTAVGDAIDVPPTAKVAEVALADGTLRVARVFGVPVPGRARLVAAWSQNEAVIAALD